MIRFAVSTFALVFRRIVFLAIAPYREMRTIVLHGSVIELLYVWLFVVGALALVTLLHGEQNALLPLAKHFLSLLAVVFVSHAGFMLIFWILALIMQKNMSWYGMIMGWSYSLIPTLVWFVGTALLFVLFPPPRTVTLLGALGSTLFLVASGVLFFWKMTLFYVALRFSLRIDLVRIGFIFCVMALIFATYSIVMYHLGIFRVPFL